MHKLLTLSGLITATLASPVLAQEPVQEVQASGSAASKSDGPKTWYVMISVEQAVGRQGCDTYHYKVSTVEPIVIQGPPEVRRAHADELTAWWMLHIAQQRPLAYRWLTTDAGHKPAQIYFRESEEEALEAFREDGGLRKSRRCIQSRLVPMRTNRFQFNAPVGFTKVDFGFEAAPQDAVVARELQGPAGGR